MALTDKLTAIANATRAKTGTTNQMTLDEIATAINGISIEKGIAMFGIPTENKSYSVFTINHSLYSDYIDTNFPFYLVIGCYITGISGMVGKILKVDRNKLTIKELPLQFGSSANLHPLINETLIGISTGSSSKTMKFSQTSTPGQIYLFGTNK